MAQAGCSLPGDTGVYVGSTLGELAAFEQAAEGAPIDVAGPRVSCPWLRAHFGLDGPQQSLATASRPVTMLARRDALRSGASHSLSPSVGHFRSSLVGFSQARAMAADRCRPDRRRSDILLGRRCDVVLERAAHARAPAVPLAEVVSIGLSCDAYHPTAQASGWNLSINDVGCSGITPRRSPRVNATAARTRASDARRERIGFRRPPAAGERQQGRARHALGAASALELAVCVQGLQAQTVPPTVDHEEPDNDDPVACTREPLRRRLRWVLNNAFAFGGINSSLLMRASDES